MLLQKWPVSILLGEKDGPDQKTELHDGPVWIQLGCCSPIDHLQPKAGLAHGKVPYCEGHRFTLTLRGLSKAELSAGLFDDRLEANSCRVPMR